MCRCKHQRNEALNVCSQDCCGQDDEVVLGMHLYLLLGEAVSIGL